MAYWIPKKDWAEWIETHQKMSDFFGIKKPFREASKSLKDIVLFFEENSFQDNKFTKQTIGYNWLYWAIESIYEMLSKEKESYDKLVDRLDSMSGWLNSKENQQVLEAKVKSLESTVERLEKKLAQFEKSD